MPFKLPTMKCDSGCGECCGLAPTTEAEFRRVEAFIQEHGIQPINQGITCPFYQEGRCAIYPVRPLSCQLFGHSEKMVCPRGYNTNIPERKLRRAALRNGSASKVLHEVLGPQWKDVADAIVGQHRV
jgi:Fe-S-cluster containining protein